MSNIVFADPERNVMRMRIHENATRRCGHQKGGVVSKDCLWSSGDHVGADPQHVRCHRRPRPSL